MHQARQHAGHLDDGNAVGAAQCILPAQLDDEVQRFVGHLRKRVRRIQADGQQQRHDLAPEIVADPAALLGRALGMRHDADALCLHGQVQMLENVVLPRNQRVRLFADLQKALLGELAFLHVLLRSDEQVGHAHFEIFVEVGGNDGQVAQSLQQRNFFACGPIQHPGVEGQNAQVAIDEWGLNGHGAKAEKRASLQRVPGLAARSRALLPPTMFLFVGVVPG